MKKECGKYAREKNVIMQINKTDISRVKIKREKLLDVAKILQKKL